MLALLAAICMTIGIVGHVAMNNYLTAQIDDGLHEAASRTFGPKGPPQGSQGQPNPLDTRGQRPGTLVALFSHNTAMSSAVVQTDGSASSLSAADLAQVHDVDPADPATEMTLSSGTYRLSVSTFSTPTGEKLVTGLSTAERDSTLRSLDLITTIVSLAGLGIIGLVGTMIVRRSLRPLDELSAVATTVATLPLDSGEASIHVRIPPMAAEPGTEVGDVGIAFNNMLEHLTRAYAARHAGEVKVRQLVADASHELRTPLTSIRGYTELVLLSETLTPSGTAAGQTLQRYTYTTYSVNGSETQTRLLLENPDEEYAENLLDGNSVLFKADSQSSFTYQGDDMTGAGQNYYLSYDLTTKKLSVISWDLNEALTNNATASPDTVLTMGGKGAGTSGETFKSRFLASTVFKKIYDSAYQELYSQIFADGTAASLLTTITAAIPASDALSEDDIAEQSAVLSTFLEERDQTIEAALTN